VKLHFQHCHSASATHKPHNHRPPTDAAMLDAIFLQGFGVELVPFVALYSAPYTKKSRSEAEQQRFAIGKIRETLRLSPDGDVSHTAKI